MHKLGYTLFLVFFHSILFSQVVVKPSEKLIYSFETRSKKTVLIALDTVHYKVIYRFGTPTNTELEIVHDTCSGLYDSGDTAKYRNKFGYYFYLRGGGVKNLGEDLNYFEFINNEFLYAIYSEYFAVGEQVNIGIRVTNLTTKTEVDIKGLLKTEKGSLADFRYGKLVVEIEDAL